MTPARARRPSARPSWRASATSAVLLLALVGYGVRLVQIQAVDAEALAAQAYENRLVTRAVPAVRGDVVDRHGDLLATTSPGVTVTCDPQLVAAWVDPADPRRAGPRAAAEHLSPVLGIDRATLADAMTGDGKYAVVARDVPAHTWRQVAELGITGIFSVPSSTRTYPAGRVAANVVGFVGTDGSGLAGLELGHDAALTGVDGSVQFERSAEGYLEIPGGASVRRDAEDGDTLVVTLDRDLQWVAEQAVAEAVTTSGAESGTVVAMDIATGEVLAMAVAPGFDANEAGDAPAELLGNRAVSEVFEPGSTSKVITVAAALEDGLAVPTTPFTVPDTIERAGSRFKDSHPHPVQRLTLAGVLAESSNTGTILASDAMAPERLHEWFTRFGYGRVTGVGLPGESAGLLPPAAEWSGSQRYTVVFGQGVSTTALQMASVFQTIANDGVRVPPRVVTATVAPDGARTPAPAALPEQVLSPETAFKVQRMLESAVSEQGTGSSAAVEGYRVAGKTGTAERYDERCGGYCGYTASFVGFAPADAPRVVVAVAVQDPERGIYGGQTAAPVFRTVMTAALAGLGVPPGPPAADLYPLTW